ncbi:hypothetical protein GLOIN_2v1778046 [Rhizophagus irregularis DAOM 181602=DAOM 197198]|uniref:Uncharacterized protein n=1 Tax=Rhizophagus irregularis (strain DAOM 197198w) TaxID=1432141 RepID=A0A015J524_RHIIW|nr:hypothetical protein RirG_141110 [Rhizophagus irregularis DAOM 197198w]GBC10967.2 hypothetical protein GLOIN_2v1778046 [Rhizophagus irregularis DAOM 181602=DAOM 197198]
MSFHRSHPRQKRTCEEHKAELEEENYHLHSELQIKVNTNRQNERQINQLEQDYTRCEQEIQDLNKEIERLKNASKEEIVDLEEQLVESEEQVKKLRCQIRSILLRKNSSEQENSSDLYNFNDNMATITELANAIDGYVDNRATTRDILIDQIKRATRQIRQKENNLHQDLVCEQRRRYDTEAECDNEIIRRQLAEGRITNVIGDLHQYQINTQNKRNAYHLQQSRGDIGLLEFNRDRLYERYEKWKNKIQAERQNNLNLQGQILALQNNPPNQVNMAGIPHLYFDWDNSIPDFLAQLRLDLQNQGIDPNDNVADPPTGRDNAIGHLRACMRGRTLEWFDDEITTKQNWELTNLLDNIGQANLVAVNGRTAVQIGANALNEAVG